MRSGQNIQRLSGWWLVLVALLGLWGCAEESADPVADWDYIHMKNAWEDDSKWFADWGKELPDGQLYQVVPPSHSGITFSNDFREDFRNNFWVFMYTSIGSGVAAGDLNNDGLCDLYFAASLGPNKLYLNQGGFKFKEVSRQAGIDDSSGFSSGVTLVDINQDGWLDIYQCQTGPFAPTSRANRLFVNNQDGTFSESAAQYGLADSSFSTHANFFDMDGDGDLDMYLLTHPNDFSERNQIRNYTKVEKGIHQSDKLFRNEGNGRFTDISEQAGIRDHGYGLSCTVGDFNNDQLPDIYIANDFLWNDLLYLNRGDGTFDMKLRETMAKTSRFAMGTDYADCNNDGFPELVTADIDMETNYGRKTDRGNSRGWGVQEFQDIVHGGYHYQYPRNTLQLNNRDGSFSEIANYAGVSTSNWSWAPLFLDADHDGHKDLFVSNGFYMEFDEDHKDAHKALAQAVRKGDRRKYYEVRQSMQRKHMKWPNELFRNTGAADVPRFERMTQLWGLGLPTLSHGAAYADLDNDGDLDLVASNTNQAMTLYQNGAEKLKDRHWIRFVFKGLAPNRAALGAEIWIYGRPDNKQYRQNYPVRGYASSVEPGLHFGLDTVTVIPRIVIRWPDGQVQTLYDMPVDLVVTLEQPKAGTLPQWKPRKLKPPLFMQQTAAQTGLDFRHSENEYDDFARQFLLPHKLSRLGPGAAAGDVNGQHRDAVYLGGAAGQTGKLYLQSAQGKFNAGDSQPWSAHQPSEDMGALFFDADGDGDNDLYVVSGGYEFPAGAAEYRDRLYLNEKGNFRYAPERLPDLRFSGSCVTAADYDLDGDLDLFVGGRVEPGAWPHQGTSVLLENHKGTFRDKTPDLLRSIGMVTTAVWCDWNADGRPDLMLTGEGMSVLMFQNAENGFQRVDESWGLQNMQGWWNSIVTADVDGDGDTDFILGNQGENRYYKATIKEPVEVFAHDFDGDSLEDVVMSYYNGGKRYPTHTLRYLGEKMPVITEEMGSYARFGNSTMEDIFGKRGLAEAYSVRMETFASAVLMNDSGHFRVLRLPPEAQLAPLYGILPGDHDGDGHIDLLCQGNFFPTAPLIERKDAGTGLLLKGHGDGTFEAVAAPRSGFSVQSDARGLLLVDGGWMGYASVLSLSNDAAPVSYLLPNANGYSLRWKKGETHAILVEMEGGQNRQWRVERQWGSAYLTGNAQSVNLYPKAFICSFYGPKGFTRLYKF